MAKKVWNNPITKEVDWGGDASTENLPVSGEMVQRFIKESLDSKAGVFYYDASNNRYLVFADTSTRDEYIINPTKIELIIGTFDAPFNYTAEITLSTPAYNAIQYGSIGNYIEFTFDVRNKSGASTGENVNVTYTFIHNATKKVVNAVHRFGESVRLNVDGYLKEGNNTVIIGIIGQTTLAATSASIVYQVVNLSISDNLDISKSYDLRNGSAILDVPFTVSGYGTKVVEWYINGALLDFVKDEDEVVDVSSSRTKHITLNNLAHGKNTLQFRAYTIINGEKFYTDILYRDVLVNTGLNNNDIIGIAITIPKEYGIVEQDSLPVLYNMIQYVPYNLRFATYSPLGSTSATIKLDNVLKGNVNSFNDVENNFVFTATSSGNKTLMISTESASYDIKIEVQPTSMNIQEITNALVLNFDAIGKNNNSQDRDSWTYGNYTGILQGFNWNNTSGWVDNRLEMNAGSSLSIDYAPLAESPTLTGKTIEIEWMSKNVKDDNAVICDLRNDDGVGILITATKVSMVSADGVVVETEYKSDENVRVGFVINKQEGTTNQRLSFIYANGIVSRCEQWSITDNYTSQKTLKIEATTGAEVSLKSIRIYDSVLSTDNMLNNYILYRDTIAEMMEVYDRNDVYADGTTTFSTDKMMGRLPVMIVTGDIPTLENTSDKDTQIVVDIEYHNMQDTSKSFKMKNAAMRPQGTSSMGYPKKNFRIYTQKIANTILYDANGNVVEDKLYSFKEGAQPVDCWCLKADYAESSGTHNTGIARLWNDALMNVQVEGDYICRTGAQKAALAAGYEYDVRTTIDGFPILLFYRKSVNDNLIFIGKYNFNNDKSTESVFGFKGIPNFDNSRMQCWEVLNNGNPLALFTTANDFDSGWSEAFESRYPDTKTPNTSDLKAFCQWMSTVTKDNFTTEKWQHLNLPMMAAYWVYLMRYAAADQFVKNAMFTSEDGQHFYYILYDNDTINGLINTGRIAIQPTDDRQTVDVNGAYVFAGHDSRLWNMLEEDQEFVTLVSTIDNALYSAGISYASTIAMFDDEQADKWVERVYNQDAQYKYIGPWNEKGINNLFMLQGKRDLHRKWWIAKRFSIYDAKYVSGTYKSQAVEVKCLNGTTAGQEFTIMSGYPLHYGFGINNVPREWNIYLEEGQAHTFTTQEVVNLGDPIRVYGAPNIASIDFSKMTDRLAVVTIANVYDDSLGTKLNTLILGNANKENNEVLEISGLKQAIALRTLDVQGMKKLTSLDLSSQPYFEKLKAIGSGISSVTFSKGAPVNRLELPVSMRALMLSQLPYIDSSNVVFESVENLQIINISNCPNITDDFYFFLNWYNSKNEENSKCSLILDNVLWEDLDANLFMDIVRIKQEGGTLNLKGKVSLSNPTISQAKTLANVFGESVFNKLSDFYIEIPTLFEISTEDDSILEGESTSFTYELIPNIEGEVKFSLTEGRQGCSINPTTGVLITSERALDTSIVRVRGTFTPKDGLQAIYDEVNVEVVRRTYPIISDIIGNPMLGDSNNFTWDANNITEVNGGYTAEWILEGNVANYFSISSTQSKSCVVVRNSMPSDTVTGSLTIKIIRNFDGNIASTKTLDIRYVMPHLNMSITSNQGSDTTISNVKATVKYGSNTVTLGNGQSLALPLNTTVTITFPNVNGYSKPDDISYTTANEDKNVSVVYSTTIVKVIMTDNQTTLNDIALATAVVSASGITNTTVSSNGTVKVPTGVSCTVTWNTLSGYSTPSAQTFTTSGTSVTKTGTYQTEILTVAVTSDISLPSSYTITVSGVGSQTTASATYKVPFGLTYTVSGSSAGGYATPTAQSFTANSVSRSVTVEYLEKKPAIIATYNVTSTSSATQLLYSSYSVSNITTMEVDGVSVTPALTYTFNTTGRHTVKIVASTTLNMFRAINILQSAVIEDGVTSIGDRAFYECSSLTSITIPDSVTEIEQSAFYKCSSLASITIPDSVTSIELNAFRGCSSLTRVTIGDSVTKIGNYAFRDCSSLASVTIGDSVTSIEDGAFYYCSSLASITIPDSVTSIRSDAFRGCSNLTRVTIGDSVTEIRGSAFRDCSSLASITIPDSVTEIGGWAFSGCSSLASVTIPESVTEIGGHAFAYCKSLTRVTIGDSVTSLGDSVFYNCTKLTSITIGDSVTSIGNEAFDNCSSLKTIYCLRSSAPSVSSSTFGSSTYDYTGRNTYSTGENMLYVPSGATGYDASYWLDPLQNSSKCGFTLSATL